VYILPGYLNIPQLLDCAPASQGRCYNYTPGVRLHYTSISKAARDYSIGKILAGWSFRKAAEDGEEMGNQIGSYVFTHQFRENNE